MIGAERLGAGELLVAAGGDDDPRASRLGELQREQRHAAGAEREHGVAGLDLALHDDGVPGRDAGAWQRGRLFEGQVLRNRQQAVLVERNQFRRHAVTRPTERRAACSRCRLAGQPLLRKDRGDTVAGLEAAHAGADRHHFTSAIRQRDQWQLLARVVLALHGHEITEVQRHGANAHQYLTGAGLRVGALDDGQLGHPELGNLDSLHCATPAGTNPVAEQASGEASIIGGGFSGRWRACAIIAAAPDGGAAAFEVTE